VKLFIFEIPICILKVSSAVAELPTSVDAPPPTFRLLGKYIRHLVFLINWNVCCIVCIYFFCEVKNMDGSALA
jgi:hypothetical protein